MTRMNYYRNKNYQKIRNQKNQKNYVCFYPYVPYDFGVYHVLVYVYLFSLLDLVYQKIFEINQVFYLT